MVEMSRVEKFMVEMSVVEKFLWTLGLKSPGLKLGVEKSGVEMSCNPSYNRPIVPLYYIEDFKNLASNALQFTHLKSYKPHEKMKQNTSST